MWFGCGRAHTFICVSVDLSVSYTHWVHIVDFNVVMRISCVLLLLLPLLFLLLLVVRPSQQHRTYGIFNISTLKRLCMCVRVNRRHTFDIESIAKRRNREREWRQIPNLIVRCAHIQTLTPSKPINVATRRTNNQKWIYNNAHGTSKYISRIFKKKKMKKKFGFIMSMKSIHIWCVCVYFIGLAHLFI